MAVMQLRPFAVARVRTVPSDFPLEVEELAADDRPAAETVELRVGSGFRNVAEVVQVLREVCDRLESGRRAGFAGDMESVG
jgi:hypothetical protein